MCQNLNIIFLSVENIEISLYAQARQSLLLLTQGSIYNRLWFLNKYLKFLEELNELFWEDWSKFLTAGYLVFWKQFPAAGYLDTSYNAFFITLYGGNIKLSIYTETNIHSLLCSQLPGFVLQENDRQHRFSLLPAHSRFWR